MANHVVILNGANGAGKDTFVKKVKSLIGTSVFITHKSVIGPIKNGLSAMKLWDGQKDEKGRSLLADMLILAKNYNPNYVTDIVRRFVSNHLINISSNKVDSILFIDMRSPEDIMNSIDIINRYDKTIQVHTVLLRGSTEPVANNKADKEVENYEYEITYDLNHEDSSVLDECALDFITSLGVVHESYNEEDIDNIDDIKVLLEALFDVAEDNDEFLRLVETNATAWEKINLIKSHDAVLKMAAGMVTDSAIKSCIHRRFNRKIPDIFN